MEHRDRFRTNFPSGVVRPTGELFNEYSRALNSLVGPIAASFNNGDGSVQGAPFIFGIAEITDVKDTCELADPEDPHSEVQAPCRKKHKYLAQFRYYDGEKKKFIVTGNDIRIDTTVFSREDYQVGGVKIGGQDDESDSSSDPGPHKAQAQAPFIRGDVVAAFFDPVSRWCLPVYPPPSSRLIRIAPIQASVGGKNIASGDLIRANSKGYHSGIVATASASTSDESDQSAENSATTEDEAKCWLAFVDRYAINHVSSNDFVVAESGLIVGPCEYVGEDEAPTSVGTQSSDGSIIAEPNAPTEKRPVFAVTGYRELYHAKSTSDHAAGDNPKFRLYNGARQDSGIDVNALLLYNEYKKDKFAIVERIMGVLIANQVQCK